MLVYLLNDNCHHIGYPHVSTDRLLLTPFCVPSHRLPDIRFQTITFLLSQKEVTHGRGHQEGRHYGVRPLHNFPISVFPLPCCFFVTYSLSVKTLSCLYIGLVSPPDLSLRESSLLLYHCCRLFQIKCCCVEEKLHIPLLEPYITHTGEMISSL